MLVCALGVRYSSVQQVYTLTVYYVGTYLILLKPDLGMAEISVKLPKPKYGQIVVLQKNGDEPRGNCHTFVQLILSVNMSFPAVTYF